MMQRVLEPEVMDSAAEANDYDAMDHAQVNRVFVADFLTHWHGSGPILDVGTGTARIPIELCRQHPSAQIVAIDLAEHMLAVARANVQKARLAACIRLERIDAKTLPFADSHFAAVISNSIVHHIPEPGAVLAEIARVLRPEGTIFIRDLLRPDGEPELQRLVQLYAGDANEHQQKMFADSLHAALTLAEIRSQVAELGFEPESVRQTSDRHWTWTHQSEAQAKETKLGYD